MKEPQIYCPKCKWRPQPESRWVCLPACGTAWNTFWTAGVCPGCAHQWTWTDCLACHQPSLHKDWLVAVNPVFGWALSSSQIAPRPSSPDFSLGYKVARTVAPEIALGFEYYNDKGAWSRFDPGSAQGKTVFAVLDFGRKPLPFNLGIGRGINGSTDKWTIKAIFEVPFR